MKLFKDLREQYVNILLEDRIDFLKQQFKDKLDTSHDDLAKHKESDKIIDHFAKRGDPSAGKAYTQWLLNQYRDKAIRQEDAPGIKNTLADFEKVKGKLEKKDINQYKDVAELRDAVATQKGTVERELKAKKQKESDKGQGLINMYDEEGVTGHKIPNKAASVNLYGPGGKVCTTSWCTAANSSNNMFNSYKGGKYTMHFPNGEVLQFHHQSGQIMDKNDRPIKEGDPRFEPYAKHIDAFLRQTEKEEQPGRQSLVGRFHQYSPEEVKHHMDKWQEHGDKEGWNWNPHDDMVMSIAKSGKLSDEHFDTLLNHGDKEGLSLFDKTKMTTALSQNPHLSDEQMGKVIEKISVRGFPANDETISNPALRGDNLHKVIDGKDEWVLNKIANKNPNLEKSHIDKLLKTSDDQMGYSILGNHGINLSKEQQEDMFKREAGKKGIASPTFNTFANRPDLHPAVVDKILDHENSDSSTRKNIINNPGVQLSKDQINKILTKDENGSNARRLFDSHHEAIDTETRDKLLDHVMQKGAVTTDLVRSKNFTGDHLNKLLGSSNDQHHLVAAASSKINSAQLHDVLDKHGKDAHSLALENSKTKPEHLKKIIDHGPESYRMNYVLNHKATNSDVLHHIYDKSNDLWKGAVLHHPAVQPSHFQKAVDGGIKMHGAISSSPAAPPSVLDKMADSPLQYVRQNVAEHKNTSNETLGKLKNDSSLEVSAAAAKRFKG